MGYELSPTEGQRPFLARTTRARSTSPLPVLLCYATLAFRPTLASPPNKYFTSKAKPHGVGCHNSTRWDNGIIEAVELNGWLHLDQLYLAEMARELGKDDAEVKASQSQMVASAPTFFNVFFQNDLQASTIWIEMCFDIGSQHLGCWGQNASRIQIL